ncbi:Bacterial extracellular solute-binding protein, family 7 [compost metagenome]
MQKNIILTGHIVDHLNTVISGKLWKSLSDADKKVFAEVAQQAAEKASAEVAASEKKMVDVFKQRGLNVAEVNVEDFRKTVLAKVPFEQYGYQKSDWEKIQAVK